MANSYTVKQISTSIYVKKKPGTYSGKLTYTIAGILLVAFIIVFGFYQNHSHIKYYQDFSNDLITGRYTEALIALESFDSVFYHKYYHYNAKDSQTLPTGQERKNFAVELIEILRHFSNEEDLSALKKLKTLRHEAEKVTAGVPDLRSNIQRLMQRRLRRIIDKYKVFRRSDILTPFKIKENHNRMYQQSVLSQDLSNEFGLLLGLVPEGISSFNDTARFYQKGILANLPILKRLPDNIKDLQALKVQLMRAGGEVNVRSTENTPGLFNKRLEELREKCAVFRDQIVNLYDENEKMEYDLKTFKKAYDAERALVKSEIMQFLLAFTEPERNISPSDFLPF